MSAIADKISSLDVAKGTPILVASGLRKTFRMGDSEIQVLSKVDLIIAAGEFIAIEGRSGSGKSTLLHLLGALDTCDSGVITFAGSDIAAMGPAERSRL